MTFQRTDPRRIRAAVACGIAALGGVCLAGCSIFGSDGDGPEADGTVRALVVGDSVTVLSKEELRAELDWVDELDVRATNGYRTDELLEGAREGAKADPDFGVFMPGYNDILQERVDTPALGEMMDIAAGLPCSVWFLIPIDGGYAPELVGTWNERVQALADEHDNVHVSEAWKHLVEATPDFTFISDVDAVHPNDAGRKAIAGAMAVEADRFCR